MNGYSYTTPHGIEVTCAVSQINFRRGLWRLLRDLDELIGEDGTVDLVCDTGMEIPLEIDNRTLTLAQLLESLQQAKRSWGEVKASSEAA